MKPRPLILIVDDDAASRSLLARQLKVSHTAVGSWETGKRLPMVDAVAKIEALTGISATQWMAWYDKRPEPD